MVEILVDVRERTSGIAARLRSFGWVVQEKKLDAADYLIGGIVGIERKTITDFAASVTHGRLFRQLASLRESVRKPLVIIEGDRNQSNSLHPNAVRGTLVAVSIGWCISTLWSQTSDETAELIHLIALRTSPKNRDWKPPSVKKPKAKDELRQELLERIPQVGSRSAKALVDHFGSFERIFTASKHDLQQVQWIGRKKASIIYQMLHE